MDNIKILEKEIETLTNKKNKTGNPAEKQIITDRIIELKKEISSLRKQIPTKIVPVINAPIVVNYYFVLFLLIIINIKKN